MDTAAQGSSVYEARSADRVAVRVGMQSRTTPREQQHPTVFIALRQDQDAVARRLRA